MEDVVPRQPSLRMLPRRTSYIEVPMRDIINVLSVQSHGRAGSFDSIFPWPGDRLAGAPWQSELHVIKKKKSG